jgi:Flp pilus assembly protein TadB
MNKDRFFYWSISAGVLAILFVIAGFVIDNLRVAINITLIMIAFLFAGCIVYESAKYLIKKVKKQ